MPWVFLILLQIIWIHLPKWDQVCLEGHLYHLCIFLNQRLSDNNYMLGFHSLFPILILTTLSYSGFYYSYFIGEEIEAQEIKLLQITEMKTLSFCSGMMFAFF